MRPFLTLHEPARIKDYYDKGVWREQTFYDLLVSHAAARPDDLALRDAETTWTWAELLGRVEALSADFEALGLCGGDRVSVWISNRVEQVVVFLACARDGLVCNPSLHNSHTCADVVALLKRLKSAVLIAEADWGADRDKVDLAAMLEDLAFLRKLMSPEELPAPGAKPQRPPCPSPDKVTYIAFTSGTTGQPKGVMHSDNTILSAARHMVETWGFGPRTRILSLSPMSHHIAWVGVAEWLLFGGLFITRRSPPGMSQLDWILHNEATYAMGVPTHAMDVLAEQKARGLDRLGKVEAFYMAGSPIPPSVVQAFVEQGIKPQNVYGMTENSSHQYTFPNDDIDIVLKTCGRGGPAYEVVILDPEDPDKYVGVGETGQIAGRGAALMLGYFGNQEGTGASFNRDGWFMSGDLGSVDEQGNLTVNGRLKDLIIRGGHNIYPAHIEALVLRHPAAEKAAVFPVSDERLGEKACVAVIGDITPEALLAHLDEQGLSKYDMPEYFLAMPAFPLTASGKILKRELIDMAKRGEIAPTPIRFVPTDG